MQENVSDAYAFLAVLCLPFLGWLVSRPPVWVRVRTRLDPVAIRVWGQIVEQEQPDEEVLRRWAAIRLGQLRSHLERVRRLILDDEWMTGTRQVGNRLAHDRLVLDVREAELAMAAFGPVEPVIAQAAPTPVSAPRFAYSAPATRSVVEMIEFGPSGRWL